MLSQNLYAWNPLVIKLLCFWYRLQEDVEVTKNSKYQNLKESGASYKHATIYTENPVKKNLGKIKKSRKIGQDSKPLIFI